MFMIKEILLLINIIFFFKINSLTIYECSNIGLFSTQCMLNWTDINGNTHISLKNCPSNKICKPNNDYSMGFCIPNLKHLLPGEKCNYGAQCVTNLCSKTCVGSFENHYCNPRSKECNQNMTCRLNYDEEVKDFAYRCANLSYINEDCDNNDDCELNLVCAYNKNMLTLLKKYKPTINAVNQININDIRNNVPMEEYLNFTKNKNKTCIERASLNNGVITNEAMACQSGELINIEIYPGVEEYFCGSKKEIIKKCDFNENCEISVDFGVFGINKMEEKCVYSNLGHLICPLDEKEKAWKNYLEYYNKVLIEDKIDEKRANDEIHIPYDKDSLHNNELSEYFWQYNDWIHTLEADECAKQYFFVNNRAHQIKYTKYLLLLISILFFL